MSLPRADPSLKRTYVVHGGDFVNAGRASTDIKDTLKDIGLASAVVRRIAIAAYEAEMNIVMYATHGTMTLDVMPACVVILAEDEGPGIENIARAMQEGYSTATAEMREKGFGAGMGLPNIQRNSNVFEITSEVGRGTRLFIRVDAT
jgi:serine/threonine-protein kinase RsbT